MVFSTMIRSTVAASPISFIEPPKPSILTQRSSESTEDATLTDVLRSFSSETSTKAIIKKISADVAQLLLAHAFQGTGVVNLDGLWGSLYFDGVVWVKKNNCVMGDVYGVLLVPKELELEKDTSFIDADLKFQLPNVGKATKEFFRSRELREFFSGTLAGATTKVVLGPLETISFTYEDSDFVDVTSMGEGENVEIHENSDRDRDWCEASRVFEADKATFYSMQFKTTEEAFAIYNQYAKLVGFNVHKDTYRMSTDGVRVKWRFLCSAAGERNVNRVKPRKRDIESRESKAITRFKCKARFDVGYDLESNLWVMKDFIGEHTHPLVPDLSLMFLRSHRNVSEEDLQFATSLVDVGIRKCKVTDVFVNRVGGFSSVGFLKKDLYNHMGLDR
ncbi:hypothetical protein IFM89_035128 [Coptis chinensis]|uniref:FAR1 domain-containing protein n=1 Tax=Coptis chinensis TaxID=261450 RepID=A0A835IPT8_9MAGN|nr:hypothetical protein IFM89_035128 [Coptis chinensis]